MITLCASFPQLYRGSAYARRRRERELELEEDERDRQREREEIESLRLEVLERQHKQKLAERGEEDGMVCRVS